jgi:hypothetical protein
VVASSGWAGLSTATFSSVLPAYLAAGRLYQHVAAASNAQSRADVLVTMGALVTRAEREGHPTVTGRFSSVM